MNTPYWAAVSALLRKDLRAEFRSRELLSTMLLFALLAVLTFSFALELDRTTRTEVIPGVLWVTVTFASILGLNRSMVLERENANVDALLLAPIPRSAVFVGKFIANFTFTLIMGLFLLPLLLLLFNANTFNGWMFVVLFLGTWGICSTGTLIAAMTVQARSRESLLPIAMLPILLPVLLAAVNAASGIVRGAPINDWQTWPFVLLVIDLAYTVICFLTFEYVIEE